MVQSERCGSCIIFCDWGITLWTWWILKPHLSHGWGIWNGFTFEHLTNSSVSHFLAFKLMFNAQYLKTSWGVFWKAFEICHIWQRDINQSHIFWTHTNDQSELVFGVWQKTWRWGRERVCGKNVLMKGYDQLGDGRKRGGVKFNKDVRIFEMV